MKNETLFILSILCALIFMVTGIFWVYWIALIIAYPFGILALVLWNIIRKDHKRRNVIIPIMLVVGFLLSIAMLLPWITNRLATDSY
jgi:ABC-type phosphate transport system permease subunit